MFYKSTQKNIRLANNFINTGKRGKQLGTSAFSFNWNFTQGIIFRYCCKKD